MLTGLGSDFPLGNDPKIWSVGDESIFEQISSNAKLRPLIIASKFGLITNAPKFGLISTRLKSEPSAVV